MPGSEKNYTAAFGTVNEEQFAVNITYINISGTIASYLTIWLHGDRDADYTGDGAASVKVWDGDNGALYGASDVVWTLAAGNNDSSDCDTGYTDWDETSHVRYSIDDTTDAQNETHDFVWVGVSLDIPSDATTSTPTGTIYIYIHFKATTQT